MNDCWNESQYQSVVSYVESRLWQYVQSNAAAHTPKQIVSSIAQLSASDLRFLLRLHFLLSPVVQECISESVPRLLRRLLKSSSQITTEQRGAVRGSVDWEPDNQTPSQHGNVRCQSLRHKNDG